MYLKATELYDEGTENWATSAAAAFDLLKHPDCRETPKPEWWSDEGLKALSARLVALTPDSGDTCSMRARVLRCDDNPRTYVMRARVLSGDALSKPPWNAGPRTAAEIKEAATWWRRYAKTTRTPADKLRYEALGSECDEFADPLLAKEEAEAVEARAAAEAEAAAARRGAEAETAEALKVAEAKARAAAEELLAEEETEKAQAAPGTKAGKAKQGKGKKGKGKR